MIEFSYPHLVLGIAILIFLLIFFARQKRSVWYLFCFSIFWLYLLYVASLIVFPIVPLPIEFSETFQPNINLIPFYFGTCDMPALCLRDIAGNILLTVPFGFGISFVARLESKGFLWLALLVGVVFEATQLIISLVFRSAFRAVDVNDVLLNATGVLIGYGLFSIFGWLFMYMTQKIETDHKHIVVYIYDVIRQSADH